MGGELVKNLAREHLGVLDNLAPETQAQAFLCHCGTKVSCWIRRGACEEDSTWLP